MDEPPRVGGRVSLRLSMAAAFVGVVVLTCLLLGSVTFLSVRSFVREDLRRRLGDVAVLTARVVDPDKHGRLKGREDEATADYRDVKAALKRSRDEVKGLRFVYTMRLGRDGQPVFVADAEEKEEDRSHIGDPYESPTEEMLASFKTPYGARVERGFTKDRWGAWLSGFAPILRRDGTVEGIVGIDMSASDVIAYERRLLAFVTGAGAAVCAVVIVIALLVSRGVSKPMLSLGSEMARIQRFDLGGECEIRSRIFEIASMRDTLNSMRHGLRSFRRYVPADLVAELIRLGKEAMLEVERRNVTIFFSDIKGFTSLAEKTQPDELMRGLGDYFKGITEAILRQKGTVDKYVGDGIMAFWGAPNPMEDHAARACMDALECQRFLRQGGTLGGAKGMSLFPTRIGLNSGEVLVGNVGYEERLNYTVMGDPVNLASRIEQLNKFYGTQIMAGESVYEAAKGAVEARMVDRVAVKGKTQGVVIYEIVAPKGGVPKEDRATLDIFGDGLDLYFRRDWAQALRRFEQALARSPDDGPSRVFVERCRRFLTTPPGPDWDGTTVLQEK